MTRRRVEPLVWLMFSAGGVLAAVFLPILAILFGLAFPLEWADPPDYQHAHRFRYTLYDGLQIKHKRTVAVLCYGTAVVGSAATLAVLWAAAQAA